MAGIMEFILEAIFIIATPQNIAILTFVALSGVLLGATPGVGPALAMILYFPFTFTLEPEIGLMIMAVLYGTTTFGGSISAILVNIPGTAGSSATLIDGYPLTQQGRGLYAIGLSTLASFTGALIGLVMLATIAPLLSRLVFVFGPPEMFMLAVFGLATVSAVSRGSLLKSFASVSLGVFLATIGTDPTRATARYVFDTYYLQGGVDIIVLVTGLFAISQAIALAVKGTPIASKLSGSDEANVTVWTGAGDYFGTHKLAGFRSGIIGSVVGTIPGVGITPANFLSYMLAVSTADQPERFGEGEPEGVVAAEAANNGAAMGALVPAMALAIPGGTAAAIFIGVMLSYGIQPGPQVFEGTLPYVIYVSILLGNLIMVIGGMFAAKYFAKVVTLPNQFILTGIVIFSLLGSFSIRNNIFDVGMALVIGILGFVMMRRGYSLIALVMGFILTPIAEPGFQRTMIISDGDYSIFFTRPISLALFVGAIFIFLLPIIARVTMNRREATD